MACQEAAGQYFDQALSMHRDLRAMPMIARTMFELACVHLNAGVETASAEQMMGDAKALYAKLGMAEP